MPKRNEFESEYLLDFSITLNSSIVVLLIPRAFHCFGALSQYEGLDRFLVFVLHPRPHPLSLNPFHSPKMDSSDHTPRLFCLNFFADS